jgi:hypothetical protein
MVSENAVVLCHGEGIYLYHIPELSSAENFSTLEPTWDWRGESTWLYGSVYMKPSQHPVLYLQGSSAMHTIVFHMGTSGRDLPVAQHRISRGLPAYLASIASLEEKEYLLVMKGRKGLCVRERVYDYETGLLGIEELAGWLVAEPEFLHCSWDCDYHRVRTMDFDERTGRILIGTAGSFREHVSGNEATRIFFADLPSY